MKSSFGYRLIEASHPELDVELRSIPRALRKRGWLDQISVQLEAIGAANAFSVRTNALRAYGVRLQEKHDSVADLVNEIAMEDPWLGMWAAVIVLEFETIGKKIAPEILRLLEVMKKWSYDEADYDAVRETPIDLNPPDRRPYVGPEKDEPRFVVGDAIWLASAHVIYTKHWALHGDYSDQKNENKLSGIRRLVASVKTVLRSSSAYKDEAYIEMIAEGLAAYPVLQIP